jgi:hypothetical protein
MSNAELRRVLGRRIVFPDAFQRVRDEADWLIDGLIARHKRHGLFADTGAGKTWLMLWAVLELIRAGVYVLYLDFELPEDDVTDILRDLGADPDSSLPGLDYRLMDRDELGALDTPSGGAALLGEARAIMDNLPDGTEIVVIADTIGKAVEGEESNNDTWKDLANWTTTPLVRLGVTWVQLDHVGHDKSVTHARGASAKRANLDIDGHLTREGDVSRLQDYKRRLSWVPTFVRWQFVDDSVIRFERLLGADMVPMPVRHLADWLDAMGVPMDFGRDRVRAVMDDKGYDNGDEGGRSGASNAVSSAAITFRRFRFERSGLSS